MAKAVSRTWVWRFDHPPAAVWPILADTTRFNEAADIPEHRVEEVLQADGSVHYFGMLDYGPYTLKWREVPVEWVAEQRFRHCRKFLNGPFRSLCATLEIAPEDGGSRVDYTLEVVADNPLGRLMLMCGFVDRVGRTFFRLADSVRGYLAGAAARPYDAGQIALARGAAERVAAMTAAIEDSPHGHGLAARLADFVANAQHSEVLRIRPRALAREWGVAERPVIECCLEAAKAGLLHLRWDLLCPRCQGAKQTVTALDQLPHGAHCPSCNVDFDRDFSKNVELTLHPSPAVRHTAEGEFCLFGPMTTPHVKVQQTLAPGSEATVAADLAFGDFRLRTLHPGGECDVTWSEGGFPTVIADGVEVVAGGPSPPGAVRLANRSDRQQTVIVESREWARDALTADRVTAMQAFRDLFSDAVLRPGDEVGVAHVAIMFTDLKGSTALYARIGDAGAYHRVREHFAFLNEAVREHDGAVVKTIGDAVMAVFSNPADGVEAGLAIQRRAAELTAVEGDAPLVIKLGLHAGPCIAVTLNDRLDYFGSTVNMAARMQGESDGADVVLSEALAADPAVAARLADLATTRDVAAVRGFPEPVPFVRIAVS